MKESFEDACRQVKRVLEEVGGSANAYDDFPTPSSTPLTPENKVSWEEAIRGTATSVTDPLPNSQENPFSSSNSPDPEEEPFVIGELITNEEILETFEDLGLSPTCESLSDVYERMVKERKGDQWECAGNITLDQIRVPNPIDSDRYYRAGIIENMGELEEIYKVLTRLARGRSVDTVTLDSGTYKPYSKGSVFIIDDEKKGLQYMWENTSRLHGNVVMENDHFIWVIRLEDQEDLGYIHNGYVFLTRE